MFRKTWSTVLLSVALFCAGVACGWLMRGDGRGTGVPPVQSGKAADSQVASNGRDARSTNGESVAEQPQFAEAIPAEEFRRRQGSAEAATVEEVKG